MAEMGLIPPLFQRPLHWLLERRSLIISMDFLHNFFPLNLAWIADKGQTSFQEIS